MNKEYLLSEASKVSLHTNLSCTCVKSLHLWLAFAPNIQKKPTYFIFIDAIYLENISKTCHPAHVRVPSGGKYWPITRPRHLGTGLSESELLVITT